MAINLGVGISERNPLHLCGHMVRFFLLAWCSEQGKGTRKGSEEPRKSQDDDVELVKKSNKNESMFLKQTKMVVYM